MQQAAASFPTLSQPLRRCSLLDHLEAEQRVVSDAILALERRRQGLLLQPKSDAGIRRIDRDIAHHSRRLDHLGELEQAMINNPPQNRISP